MFKTYLAGRMLCVGVARGGANVYYTVLDVMCGCG